jgi:hypothetical protein
MKKITQTLELNDTTGQIDFIQINKIIQTTSTD